MKKTKLTDSELCTRIDSLLESSNSAYSSGSETTDRPDAIRYYNGEKYGNEEAGQSQVVTREVMEAIEWSMPALIRVFVGGEQVVSFNPVGAEDEEAAKQETDVVNHVATQENNAFLIFYDWFKDALLQRNGYIKIYWDEEVEVKTEIYEGLYDEQLAQFADSDEVEITEHTERFEIGGVQTPMGVMQMPVTLHDIKCKITTTTGGIKIDNTPPEEVKVHKNTRTITLDDSPFVAHEGKRTRTDLLELGIDAAIIDTLMDERSDTSSEIARTGGSDTDEAADETMEEVSVDECYLYIDYDGDGKAEYRRILKSGTHILINEEFDYCPFESLTPIRMPHKHIGISKADQAMDIQLIKSTLIRQMLTNLYLTNNPEKEVNENTVNMDDLLSSSAGGIKRVTEMGSIREIAVPFTAGASLPMLDVLDTMLQKRTGVSMQTMAMDADVLARSTKGAFMGAMEKGNEQTELMARLFAETGVKGMFRKIHHLLRKHQDKAKTIKLRGKWVDVNPQEWKERNDLTISVGLGTASKDSLIQRLLAVGQKQLEALQLGIPVVTPENYYNTLSKLAEAADLKGDNVYFTNPQMIPPKQPAPDPNMMLAQMQIKMTEMQEETKRMSAQIDAQVKSQEMQLKYKQFEVDSVIKATEVESGRAKTRDTLASAQKKEVETAMLLNPAPQAQDNSLVIEAARLEAQTAQAMHKAAVVAETELQKASITAAAQIMAAQANKPPEQKQEPDHIVELLNQNAELIKTLGKPRKVVRGEDGKAQSIVSE